MGAVCCCLMDDYEELTNQNSSVYRNCICLRCFVQYFLNVYATLFHRREQYALPSSPQETASLDNSLAEMYRPPPRPLPYDADPRIFHSQRDGLVSRKEKASSHLNDDTEPLTTSDPDEESESLSNKNKWNEFPYEGPKEYSSKLSQKFSMDKTAGFAHIYASFKDEDVCPTCLEEYTTENPKIITKCSHHFHLGCIYEWMERSDNCPVCGKEMEFDET